MTEPELTDDQVISAARLVIAEQFVGVMTTVDAAGTPHARWMGGAVEGEGLSSLLAVSARGARKLDQLADNASVCWLFSDSHNDEVVTLIGTATILEEQTLAGPAWDAVQNATKKYAMNLLSEAENLWFVGIETTVTQIEYMNPKRGLTHPVLVEL
ncbi:MAG: pyridoxamine 5'-phosphate oxidase family protein [Planctomycetota bacterium]